VGPNLCTNLRIKLLLLLVPLLLLSIFSLPPLYLSCLFLLLSILSLPPLSILSLLLYLSCLFLLSIYLVYSSSLSILSLPPLYLSCLFLLSVYVYLVSSSFCSKPSNSYLSCICPSFLYVSFTSGTRRCSIFTLSLDFYVSSCYFFSLLEALSICSFAIFLLSLKVCDLPLSVHSPPPPPHLCSVPVCNASVVTGHPVASFIRGFYSIRLRILPKLRLLTFPLFLYLSLLPRGFAKFAHGFSSVLWACPVFT